jgi:hypothetical protein
MTALLKVIEGGGGTAQPSARVSLPSAEHRGTSTEMPRSLRSPNWIDVDFDFWTDFIEASVMTSGVARGIHAQPQSSSRLWSHTIGDYVDRLGRMQDGWAGEDSKAPSPAAIRDLQALTPFFPLMTRTPEIEIEPSDGEIKLAWRASSHPRSIAVAVAGDSVVRVLQTNLDDPVSTPFLEVSLSISGWTTFALAITGLQNSDLLEAE